MDYLALRIPADIDQKITAHTITDQPEPEEGGGYPFKGEKGVRTMRLSHDRNRTCGLH